MEMLNVPVKSISDLKASPMTIFEESKLKKLATYIFNRNKAVGVVLPPDLYESLVSENIALQEKLLDVEIEKVALERITQKLPLIPAEEVMGENWEKGLENIIDDWE